MTEYARSRSLKLHVSALNDAEYNLYTTSFRDLVDVDGPIRGHLDDSQYDLLTISVREARAWLRGRYSDIPLTDIDTILRIISPNHSNDDALTGGQFFAVMRLIMHSRAGKSVDSALVFIQGTSPSSMPCPVPVN